MKLEADRLAARRWIYPLNQSRRDYQFNIVKKCLFDNTLVALPTGLGKTFIAGVVMLNCKFIALDTARTNSHLQSILGSPKGRSSSLHQPNHLSHSKLRLAIGPAVSPVVMRSNLLVKIHGP